MTRLIRILLFALLLAPASAQAVRPVLEVVAEAGDECCPPEEACGEDCPECPCCAAGAITLESPVVGDVLDGPPSRSAPVNAVEPPVAPRTEILHVPKSA